MKGFIQVNEVIDSNDSKKISIKTDSIYIVEPFDSDFYDSDAKCVIKIKIGNHVDSYEVKESHTEVLELIKRSQSE